MSSERSRRLPVYCHVLIGAFCSAIAVTTHAEEFKEPGRIGVEGLVTADGVHAGVTYVGQAFEAALDLDGSLETTNPKQQDMGAELRLGARFDAGSYNFFSLGWYHDQSLFGMDDGVSTAGSYYTGPYVGFQRYFPNTPVMLTFFVMPYTYKREVSNDGSGGRDIAVHQEFFQEGGMGIVYLF